MPGLLFIVKGIAPRAPGGADAAIANPQPSVTPDPLKQRDSKTSRFQRTIEVIHDPRLFAARRFSS
ncbi:MAG: hypothetical protein ACM35G_08905, partial [Planctomycetaceae bacterium]